MFFRRKKQPDTDQSVLTETLRSLEDLIAETNEPALTKNGQKSAHAESRDKSEEKQQDGEGEPDSPRDSDPTAGDRMPATIAGDDMPVLTKVVYRPPADVPAAESTAPPQSSSIDRAHQTVAKTLVNSVRDRLDTKGQRLDPELARDLEDAVSASLEDWSIRTQEILLKRFTSSNKK